MARKQTPRPAGSLGRGLLAVAGLALVGTLRLSAAQIGDAGDARLRRVVQEGVRTDPFLGVFDHVFADVDGGRVWLRGSVEQRQRREAAAVRIARLTGVLEVFNEIEVQSAAPEDVWLRRRLFERLYYGGAIAPGRRPEWPVRILVSEGRVTLAGEVVDGTDLHLVEAMARSLGARFVDTQLLLRPSSTRLAAARCCAAEPAGTSYD